MTACEALTELAQNYNKVQAITEKYVQTLSLTDYSLLLKHYGVTSRPNLIMKMTNERMTKEVTR